MESISVEDSAVELTNTVALDTEPEAGTELPASPTLVRPHHSQRDYRSSA